MRTTLFFSFLVLTLAFCASPALAEDFGPQQDQNPPHDMQHGHNQHQAPHNQGGPGASPDPHHGQPQNARNNGHTPDPGHSPHNPSHGINGPGPDNHQPHHDPQPAPPHDPQPAPPHNPQYTPDSNWPLGNLQIILGLN